LVEDGVDVIIAVGVNAAKAEQAITKQTPIVVTIVDDPIAYGLIKSFAQPVGNATGVTDLALQLRPKRLQLSGRYQSAELFCRQRTTTPPTYR
jgi:putative ABC transport system substrate-binding protein